MLRCSSEDYEPRDAVCGGVNLLPEELLPMGTRFCRVVVVELLPLEDDELPLDDDDPDDDDPDDDWLPYPGAELTGCCTTGAGA
jgi:hypothetical protein